jgi:prolyl-tRNA editing enzyme YbaK/EbsC (Cys-tRNA(Pro) deacylase)
LNLPESTRTAAQAAAAIGTSVGQIAKSLIFQTTQSGEPILVIASGANLVNVSAVGAHLGQEIRKADADFVKAKTGFAIGGVPPVGHDRPPRTYLDVDLLRYEEIWAAAGTPYAVFRLSPQDLVRISGGTVIPIH